MFSILFSAFWLDIRQLLLDGPFNNSILAFFDAYDVFLLLNYDLPSLMFALNY